MGDLIKMNKQ